MFWIFLLRIMGITLGVHSLFQENMLLEKLDIRLQNWAAKPRQKALVRLVTQLNEGIINPVEYADDLPFIQHRRTGREFFLKPLYRCVGCMSGPYGFAVFLLSAICSGDWTGFILRFWLDGLAAIFAAVFLNRLLWAKWEIWRKQSEQ